MSTPSPEIEDENVSDLAIPEEPAQEPVLLDEDHGVDLPEVEEVDLPDVEEDELDLSQQRRVDQFDDAIAQRDDLPSQDAGIGL